MITDHGPSNEDLSSRLLWTVGKCEARMYSYLSLREDPMLELSYTPGQRKHH